MSMPVPSVQTNIETRQHSDASSPRSTLIVPQQVAVTFFPPLNDARRAWILKNLREERVSSVLDVGCGGGTLLSCFCNPPAFFDASKNSGSDDATFSLGENDGLPDLHISHVAGLDISKHALEKCMIATDLSTAPGYHSMPRWEPLEVKIWLGSLDVYNPEFVDTECIVASEVIEHLPPSVLPAFAPTLLGLYRPRLLLVTTPNYAFNTRFSTPGIVDPEGFPDPTGRTTRVFRHHDHKFEWTPSEFREWCTEAASDWGYTIGVDAIGLPMESDPWGRDEELGRASQVAMFRRIDDWQGRRPAPCLPTREQAHVLLKTHVHQPHPRAGIPDSSDTIVELVSKYMESYYFDDGYSIWDLWVDDRISTACGGRVDALLRALDDSPTLTLTRTKGLPPRQWNVKFAGYKHQEAVGKTKNTRFWDRSSPERIQNYRSEKQTEAGHAENESSCLDATSAWHQLAKKGYTDGAEVTWETGDAWALWDRDKFWSTGWGQAVET